MQAAALSDTVTVMVQGRHEHPYSSGDMMYCTCNCGTVSASPSPRTCLRLLVLIHPHNHTHRLHLLPPHCCLHFVPQEQRNILALAFGLKGIAAIRAVLNWAPVQAHATSHRVTAYYVTRSRTTAAFVTEWDQWREAGVSRGAVLGYHLLGCVWWKWMMVWQ